MTQPQCSTLSTSPRYRRTDTAGDAKELDHRSDGELVLNRAAHWLLRLPLLAGCLLMAVADSVTAGSLSVSPIRIDLSSTQRSVALTVRNDGNQPAVVQAQLVAWSQADSNDQLEPTTDILVSPPIFTVAAGASQMLRIALRRAPDITNELSYRILVTEVPGKPEAGFIGAQFAVKISLPIFVEASGGKNSPQLAWSGARTAKGELELTAFNSGAKHIQVQAIEVTKAGSDPDGAFSGPWYVLPGQRRTVTIKPIAGHTIAADRVRVKAETDAGPLDVDVALEHR